MLLKVGTPNTMEKRIREKALQLFCFNASLNQYPIRKIIKSSALIAPDFLLI